MNGIINICYIDDRINRDIQRYLNEFSREFNKYIYEQQDDFSYYTFQDKNNDVIKLLENKDLYKGYEIKFSTYKFLAEDSYKTLLENEYVNNSNIIVIDSALFENEASPLSKFTGEQFKIILRQLLPFIKTIVISQNGGKKDSSTVEKWKGDGDSKVYYHEKLLPILSRCIFATIEEQKILNQLSQDDVVDEFLIDTIKNTASGIIDTALFEKKDLDDLINLFNEVKHHYDK